MLTDGCSIRWTYVTRGVSGLNQMFEGCVSVSDLKAL